MASDSFGLTFSPTTTTDPTKQNGSGPSDNVQEAIRTLSLRLPSVVGSRAPIPQGLLNAPGAAGVANPNGMALERLLQMLFGQMQGGITPQTALGAQGMPAGSPGAMPMGAPSAPRFSPGLETGSGPMQSPAPSITTTTGQSAPLTPQMPNPPSMPTAPTGGGLFTDPTVTNWDSPNWA
jgi:hypothetical protein